MAATDCDGRQRVVVDCDVGLDDAQALLMLLHQTHIQVVAVTTTYGNTSIDYISRNVLIILKLAKRLDIPVYKGCRMTLTGRAGEGDGFMGEDGLGDAELGPQYTDGIDASSQLQPEHASLALVQLAKRYKGLLTVVALGPVTNLALATQLDADFTCNLHNLVIMGGNSTGRGNKTMAAEFNFYSDPEAACCVLEQFGANHKRHAKVTLVPMETCDNATFTWEWYDKFINIPTENARFLQKAEKNVTEREKQAGAKDYYLVWDQLTAAIVIDPEVITQTEDVYCTVETSGTHTRGSLVIDWRKMSGKAANVVLVKSVNQSRFERLMHDVVAE